MATSVERLLVTAKVGGDEYLKLKAERRILLLRFGSTLQAQQAFFQERGGLAACLVTVENDLLQLEAKYGGPLAFGKWLNDSARKRMEGKRAELRLQLRALRRIVELEDVGDDEGRRTAMHRAWLDFFAKCAALARDAKDARDRRVRKRAADAGIDADLLLMRETAERVKPDAELERQRREAVHADRMAMVSAAERVKPLVELEQQRLEAVDGLDLARAVEERANADLAAAAATVAAWSAPRRPETTPGTGSRRLRRYWQPLNGSRPSWPRSSRRRGSGKAPRCTGRSARNWRRSRTRSA